MRLIGRTQMVHFRARYVLYNSRGATVSPVISCIRGLLYIHAALKQLFLEFTQIIEFRHFGIFFFDSGFFSRLLILVMDVVDLEADVSYLCSHKGCDKSLGAVRYYIIVSHGSDKLDYEVCHKAENVKALALFLLVCGKDK